MHTSFQIYENGVFIGSFCNICNLGFDFLSKYQVYLQRPTHRALEDILNKVSCSAPTGDQATPLDTTACLRVKGMPIYLRLNLAWHIIARNGRLHT